MARLWLTLALVCLFLPAPSVVSAQELSDPLADEAETARLHIGPLAVTPGLEIRQVGVDTNVFNNGENPQRDFTAAVGPRARYWLRLGRLRLRGDSGLVYHYFHEFSTQRSFGTDNELRLSLPLNRFTPFVKGVYDNSRQRPDYEIDARVRTRTTILGGGVDIKPLSRTTLRLQGEEGRIKYEDDAVYFGTPLREALDRRTRLYRVAVRQRLTPLTTFVAALDRQQDRFDFQPVRDADSYRVLGGFELDPFALISGEAFVGFRSFTTLDADTPDFDGLAAIARVAYVLRSTRFGLIAERDTAYSFEIDEPFYVVTDLVLDVTQKVTSNWDVVGRVGRQTLQYHRRGSAGTADRTDTVWLAGGGIGRRIGRTSRIGFDADHLRRDSPLPDRAYEGWRIGASLTYGVQ